MLAALEAGFDKYKVDLELQRNLRDVHDHAIRVVERADSFRVLLQNALTVHTTLVGQQQNDEMRSLTEASLAQNEEVKRISSWAAILFAPTLVGTIYGMNFTHMPELHWTVGYPLAVALMVVTRPSPVSGVQAEGLAVADFDSESRTALLRLGSFAVR